MASEKLDEKAIFNVARQIESPEARLNYLRHVCGADADLLERVETLLRAFEEQASFLESPPAGRASPTIDQPVTELPGMQIGPYKLLQQIGEGGMGVVYMAEQLEPVKRRVALKIIKPGMDTRQVIARFEAERQALSLMDHPNIAKVLDAGSTDSGRPYFVMELVKGEPITNYCDEHHLTPRQRLELLLPVCQAIQHAHQKGIIHRDIKPTNILVAEFDEKAVPIVIDFGVAKATSQLLTERTLFTSLGQIVGTLEYMSPEQAKVNQLDIDTRSDIYSLGVLLYELLTGSTPFDRQRLRSAAFDEMLRIIREEEPPKPSKRLSDSIDSLPSVSAQRQTLPAKLTRLVCGELDWIVMKALEKDRNRRYESANGFAADIERFLNDETVQACPPSAAYRLRKFTRRHKVPLAVLALVLLFLVLLGSGAAWVVWDRSIQQAEAADARAAQFKALADSARARQNESAKQVHIQKGALIVDGLHTPDWPKRASHEFSAAIQLGHYEEASSRIAATLCGLDAAIEKSFPFDAQHVLFGADGKTIIFAGSDGRTRVWHTESDRMEESETPGVGPLGALPDGTLVQLTSLSQGRCALWSVNDKKSIVEFSRDQELIGVPGEPPVAALATNASFAASSVPLAEGRAKLAVWSNRVDDRGKLLLEIDLDRPTTALTFTPDGSRLAVGDSHGTVTVWSIPDGAVLTRIPGNHLAVQALAFGRNPAAPRGLAREPQPPGPLADWLLAVGDEGSVATVWEFAEEPIARCYCRGAVYGVFALAFSGDGMTLASTGRYGVYLWNAATGEAMFQAPASDYNLALAFSPDGRRLAAAGARTSSYRFGGFVWRFEFDRGIRELQGLSGPGAKVAFSEDGRYLAALSQAWQVCVWDLPEHRLVRRFDAPPGFLTDNAAIALSGDGGHLGFSAGKRAVVWSVTSGALEADCELPPGLGDRLAFTPDGKRLLSFRFETQGGEVEPVAQQSWRQHPRVCRLRDLFANDYRKPMWEVADANRHVHTLVAASDGTWFAVDGRRANDDDRGPGEQFLAVYDGESGKEKWRFTLTQSNDSSTPIVDATSNLLAAWVSTANETRLFDAATGRTPTGLKPDLSKERVASLAPSAKYFACLDANGLSLCRGADGKRLVVLGIDDPPMTFEAQFTRDGRSLAWANREGTVFVADIQAVRRKLSGRNVGLEALKE